MFDIGFPELLLIAIVGLLVIGPERLPETLRTLGLWFGRMRRSFLSVKTEIEKEIGMDEVRRQLHNEAIMEEMKRIEEEVKKTADTTRASLDEGARMAEPAQPTIDPNVGENVADLLAAQDGAPVTSSQEAEPAADDRDHSDAADFPDTENKQANAGRDARPTTAGDPAHSRDPGRPAARAGNSAEVEAAGGQRKENAGDA